MVATPQSRLWQALPLTVLSTVPIAIASYGPAVQLTGALSNQQALLLQCGTYFIASSWMWFLRFAKEHTVHVHSRTWHAGIELGLWIFCGATLQSFGLQRTTSARAGFLVQLSTVFVPLAECILNKTQVSQSTAISVLCALAGLALLVGSPSSASTADVRTSTWQGDALTASSAMFYSGHILRLSTLAKQHNNVELAQAKSVVQLGSSLVTFAVMVLTSSSFSEAIALPAAALRTILYTGFITCAYPMWAQGFGQAHVKATQASLIYATAPVWNAVIAAILLGQNLGLQGMLGAGLMMAGFLLTVLSKKPAEKIKD